MRLISTAFCGALAFTACNKKDSPESSFVANTNDGDNTEDAPATTPPDKPGCAKQLVVSSHACALYGEGKIACWIYDIPDLWHSVGFSPKPVRFSGTPVELFLKGRTLCAKNTIDELWCVGENAHGFLRTDTKSSSKIPVKHPIGSAAHIEDLEPFESCALDNGKVLCWRTEADLESRSYDKLPGRAKQLVSGLAHRCALLESGQVWCVGSNQYGQLGNVSLFAESETEEQWRWHAIEYVRTELVGKATQVAAGYSHTCALLEGGAVWCWGENFAGEIGNGEVLECDDITYLKNCDPGPVYRPTHVQGVSNVTQIAAGGHSTCAVDRQGKVWCWGANELNSFENSPQKQGRITHPLQIPLPEPMTAVQTAEGSTCTLSATGHVYCWGSSIERGRKNPVRIALECGDN